MDPEGSCRRVEGGRDLVGEVGLGQLLEFTVVRARQHQTVVVDQQAGEVHGADVGGLPVRAVAQALEEGGAADRHDPILPQRPVPFPAGGERT
ncbi:hypothetical protein Kpho02_05640 [Kitasatospora phosalacinea]|uniref:Uncharacterized protein n=1 Tax=Kitasatospora phosalacinea TaxID=2065 RepID=A0A9W6Q1H3_9ACTN|nr:hypothetical protein [Kitasatospora phosalacinea]GLW68265.1 hypothetical protein Kpho02_05640 [Kitasatospora phosalacinea]